MAYTRGAQADVGREASPPPAPVRRLPRLRGRDGFALPLSAAVLGMLFAGRGVDAVEPGSPSADGPPASDREPLDGDAGPAGAGGAASAFPAGSSDGPTRAVLEASDPALAAPIAGSIAAGPNAPADGGRGPADVETAQGGPPVASPAGATDATLTIARLEEASAGGGTVDPGVEPDPDPREPIGDVVRAGDGDDTIVGTDRADNIDGGGGNDTIHGGAGGDTLSGNVGDDALFGEDGDDVLDGGPGNDRVDGGPGDDIGFGGTGDDRLAGGPGNDRLDGGEGDDVVDGGPGRDRLLGGPGDDGIRLNSVSDVVIGGANDSDFGANDTLIVTESYADDFAHHGGSPDDVLFRFEDRFDEPLPAGANTSIRQIHTTFENITLEGSADYDVQGGDGANRILGNAGDNRLWGMDGDDVISGAAGDDVIRGGAGNDTLAGDDGNDLVYGGAGDDRYLVGLHDGAIDTIFDFEGANVLEIDGVDDQAVALRLVGDDLHVFVGDEAVAIWSDFAGHQDSLAGIEWGQGPVAPADLLPSAPAANATMAAAGGDLLAAFVPHVSEEADAGESWFGGEPAEAREADGGTGPGDAVAPAADGADPSGLVRIGAETWAFGDLGGEAVLLGRVPEPFETDEEVVA